jgi:hypothetical protein
VGENIFGASIIMPTDAHSYLHCVLYKAVFVARHTSAEQVRVASPYNNYTSLFQNGRHFYVATTNCTFVAE